MLISVNKVDRKLKEGTDKIRYWAKIESSLLDSASAALLDLPGL